MSFILFCGGLEKESVDVTPLAAISSVMLFNFPFLINPLE